MERARDEPLACPRFTENEDRHVRLGHARDEGRNLAQPTLTTDESSERRPLAEGPAKRPGFPLKTHLGERPLQKQRQLADFERLRQVMVRPHADRLDRGVDGAVRRHHDHRAFASMLL
jgi:hypothetical protein